MKKLKKMLRQIRYSEETVYVYSEIKNRQKAKEAMKLHEAKIIATVSFCIFLGQVVMLLILGLI